MDNRSIIRQLSMIFHDALSRCTYCRLEGEVYDCEECQANKEQFVSAIIDLLNQIEPSPIRRFLLMFYAESVEDGDAIYQAVTKRGQG